MKMIIMVERKHKAQIFRTSHLHFCREGMFFRAIFGLKLISSLWNSHLRTMQCLPVDEKLTSE